MRINKYIAQAIGMGRRKADEAIKSGNVLVNGQPASLSDQVSGQDEVVLDGETLSLPAEHTTIMLNKPAGYVCSRDGQGAPTVYDLLPEELHDLKPVGRLDKDSSGLLLMTNDGDLAQELTHPSHGKYKVYEVNLNEPLDPADIAAIDAGVELEDGLSKFDIKRLEDSIYQVTMKEGRNRQIRRTFETLGYKVKRLQRVRFGDYVLGDLAEGKYKAG